MITFVGDEPGAWGQSRRDETFVESENNANCSSVGAIQGTSNMMNDASSIEGVNVPPLPGLPVSLRHDAYKGEAPTDPGAIGRRGTIFKQQRRSI